MKRATNQVERLRGAVIATIAILVLTGCAATVVPDPVTKATTAASASPVVISDMETEEVASAAEVLKQEEAAKNAERAAREKAEADAAALQAKQEAVAAPIAPVGQAPEAPAPIPAPVPAPAPVAVPVAPVPAPVVPKVAPVQSFDGWVNSVLSKYGVSPGPGARFTVGNTGFCGGYMCTTVYRQGKTVMNSLTTVSPGAIGNEFALIHEVAHQHGVGYPDTGGECAADIWARQYVGGSIYC